MKTLRIGLPVAMVLGGIALVVFGGNQADGAGVTIIGAAALVLLANGLLRMSMAESGDRDREEAARDHYRRHGTWPDEG